MTGLKARRNLLATRKNKLWQSAFHVEAWWWKKKWWDIRYSLKWIVGKGLLGPGKPDMFIDRINAICEEENVIDAIGRA